LKRSIVVPAIVAPAVPAKTTMYAGMTKNAGSGVPSICDATTIEAMQKPIPMPVIAFIGGSPRPSSARERPA
jgi:hypothetical protein